MPTRLAMWNQRVPRSTPRLAVERCLVIPAQLRTKEQGAAALHQHHLLWPAGEEVAGEAVMLATADVHRRSLRGPGGRRTTHSAPASGQRAPLASVRAPDDNENVTQPAAGFIWNQWSAGRRLRQVTTGRTTPSAEVNQPAPCGDRGVDVWSRQNSGQLTELWVMTLSPRGGRGRDGLGRA
jgi:hypothetical protein